MPTYSIIIPVYNVEAYLPACLDSVLAQDTASDYEVILVDDGSTDRSGVICDEYAAKHPAFRVIHKPNGGVSAARNAGLDAAQGGYVLFLDSDDLWKPELLSTMDTFLDRQPDIVQFCFQCFHEGGLQDAVHPGVFPHGEDGASWLERTFSQNGYMIWAVWSRLYRRSFLEEHPFRFIEGVSYAEDMDFHLTSLPYAKRVESTDQVLLLYRVRSTGLALTVSEKSVRAQLTYYAKWAREYRTPSLGNGFVGACFQICRLGSSRDTKALQELFWRNRDVLRFTDGYSRLLAGLVRLFGIYGGCGCYRFLLAVKHCFRQSRT